MLSYTMQLVTGWSI